MSAETSAIGIMCKAPRAGFSKTRLIPALGAETAASLSRAFLQDLSASIEIAAQRSRARGWAVFAPADAEPELRAFLPDAFAYLSMAGEHFGDALFNAGKAILASGHDCVLLVSGDSPTLPPELLDEAIALLRRPGDRVVFGPALDGGYTLIGLRRPHRHLFERIEWSTSRVLEQSRQRAREIGLECLLLEPWYDVDDADSLATLQLELGGTVPPRLLRLGSSAVETRRVLDRHRATVRP